MNDHREQLERKAEFYLCMAQAFHAPRTSEQFAALRDLLPGDLEELDVELGYELTHSLTTYREAMSQHDAASLLQMYSGLFLTPPILVHINAAAYLDGGAPGATVQRLEEIYRRCGVERAESFHDRADHIAVQLEFVAYLYAAAASGHDVGISGGQFLGLFPARWLPSLSGDLMRAGGQVTALDPYRPLIDALRRAIDTDAEYEQPSDERLARKQRALAKARAKRAGREVGAKELAEITAKLRAAGLSIDHLPATARPLVSVDN